MAAPDEAGGFFKNNITGEESSTADPENNPLLKDGSSAASGEAGVPRKGGPGDHSLDDAIEHIGYGRYQAMIFALIAASWTTGMALTDCVLPWVLVGAEKELNLTAWQQGLIACVALVGQVVGCFFGGLLSDGWGRRPAVMTGLALSLTANACTAVSYHYLLICLFRTIQGMGSACIMMVGKILIAETHPRSVRGKWNAFVHFFWQVGGVVITVSSYFLPMESWRVMVLCSCIPGACLLPLMYFFLDESPRYLLMEDHERAQAAVMEIADLNGAQPPPGRLIAVQGDDTSLSQSICSTKVIRSMLKPSRRRLTLVLVPMWILLNFGAYSNFLWFLKFLVDLNRTRLKQAAYFAMYGGKMFGVFVGMAIIDGYGRIALMVPGFVIAALCTLLAVLVDIDPFVVTSLFINFVGEEMVWCSLTTYTPEMYPSRIRAVSFGIITAVGHVGAVVSGFFGPMWMKALIRLPFYLNSSAFLIGGLLALMLPGDSVGQPLQDDDDDDDDDKLS